MGLWERLNKFLSENSKSVQNVNIGIYARIYEKQVFYVFCEN